MDYVDLGPAMAESALSGDAEAAKLHIIALCKRIDQLELAVFGESKPHIQPKKFGYQSTWQALFKGKEPDPETDAENRRRREELLKYPHLRDYCRCSPWGYMR